jgi:spermidine synthase
MSEKEIFEKLNEGSGAYFTGTLVEKRVTPYQTLEIYDTPELGRVLRLDGCNMTSERDEFFYHENLVHPALTAHPDPRTALVIGGGDGGSSEEILKHSTIELVQMVELDAEVIEVAKAEFAAVHRGVFANPRLSVKVGDGLAYLRNPARKYDFIALDLTDPVGPAAGLYSPAFFGDCLSAMNAGGVLALHLGSPIAHPERVKACVADLRSVFTIVRPYFVHIPSYGSVWGFACASNSLDACAIEPRDVETRLAQRGVGERRYYNGEIHRALFALPEYIKPMVG